MVSLDDSFFYKEGNNISRVKMERLQNCLSSFIGLEMAKFTNPKNDKSSMTVVSGTTAKVDGFSVGIYAYNDTKWGEYMGYTSTKEITFPEDVEVYAIKIEGKSNTESPTTIKIQNKTYTLPAVSKEPFRFVVPLYGSLPSVSFVISAASRLIISLYYAKPLTLDGYNTWTNTRGAAVYDGTASAKVANFGVSLNPGDLVYGTESVDSLSYLDLSDYRMIKITGAMGASLKFLYNRNSPSEAPQELIVNLDRSGYAILDISDFPMFHLNAIKAGESSFGCYVKSMILFKKYK